MLIGRLRFDARRRTPVVKKHRSRQRSVNVGDDEGRQLGRPTFGGFDRAPINGRFVSLSIGGKTGLDA